MPETLPVVFRVYRSELCAYFPTEEWSAAGDIMCYARVGQHCGASRVWLTKGRPARPDEYADLLTELRDIYETGDEEDRVELRVMKRAPRRKRR